MGRIDACAAVGRLTEGVVVLVHADGGRSDRLGVIDGYSRCGTFLKVHHGDGVEGTEGFLRYCQEYLPDALLVLKFYLCLGGMYVDIYLGRVNLEAVEIGYLFV